MQLTFILEGDPSELGDQVRAIALAVENPIGVMENCDNLEQAVEQNAKLEGEIERLTAQIHTDGLIIAGLREKLQQEQLIAAMQPGNSPTPAVNSTGHPPTCLETAGAGDVLHSMEGTGRDSKSADGSHSPDVEPVRAGSLLSDGENPRGPSAERESVGGDDGRVAASPVIRWGRVGPKGPWHLWRGHAAALLGEAECGEVTDGQVEFIDLASEPLDELRCLDCAALSGKPIEVSRSPTPPPAQAELPATSAKGLCAKCLVTETRQRIPSSLESHAPDYLKPYAGKYLCHDCHQSLRKPHCAAENKAAGAPCTAAPRPGSKFCGRHQHLGQVSHEASSG